MLLRVLFSLCCSCLLTNALWAQITVDPPFPRQTDVVNITFDASQGTAGLKDCACDVYIHTGLITNQSTSAGDWKFVPTTWGQANNAWKLTRVQGEDNLYRFTVNIPSFYNYPAGTIVQKLAMVFRDATGGREGKAAGGADIFYDVTPANAAFQVRLREPSTSSSLVKVDDILTVDVVASEPVQSFALSRDGQVIDTQTGGTDYRYTFPAVQGLRRYRVLATATDGDTSSVAFNFFGIGELAAVALPAGLDPGYTKLPNGRSAFYLYAPNKEFALVRLSTDNFELADGRQMAPTTNGLGFYLELPTPGNGDFSYQYLVENVSPIADPFSELVLDPNNDRIIRNVGWTSIPTLPAGIGISTWVRPEVPFTWTDGSFTPPADKDLVIYELLIRDFTAAHSYQSLIDSLGYFRRLGVNAIELMPVNEFEGNESWGYNPSYHMALDKYYGPPEAFKAFVNAAHAAGIAVIVDVVFNHGFGQNPYVQLYATETVEAENGAGPFYNLTARHPFNVGVDANHESIHTKRYVGRILRHMLEEYHLDGFRFDLSKGFTQRNTPSDVGAWGRYDATRIAILNGYRDTIRAVDNDAYVIYEHFAENSEEQELTAGGAFVWGNMSGAYADAAVGRANNNFYGVTPQSRGFNNPRLIGYMESHDEERMMFRVLNQGGVVGDYNVRAYSTAHERAELAAAFFYTTPGAKMLWQFGEYGYPISIDFNGRVGNKPIRWDLLNQAANRRLFDVTAALINLRRNHPVFSSGQHNLPEGLSSPGTKSLQIRHTDMNAVVVGNFQLFEASILSTFPNGGTYYDYFTGDSLVLSGGGADASRSLTLRPGEYHLFTSKRLPAPPNGFPRSTSGTADTAPAGARVSLLNQGSSLDPIVQVEGWEARDLHVELYTSLGQLVLAQALNLDGQTTLHAGPLAAGNYALVITDEQGRKWSGILLHQ